MLRTSRAQIVTRSDAVMNGRQSARLQQRLLRHVQEANADSHALSLHAFLRVLLSHQALIEDASAPDRSSDTPFERAVGKLMGNSRVPIGKSFIRNWVAREGVYYDWSDRNAGAAELGQLERQGIVAQLLADLRARCPNEAQEWFGRTSSLKHASVPVADTPSATQAAKKLRKQSATSATEDKILKHCRRKAHKGERIAVHVGLSNDHVRHVCANLVKRGLLRKTDNGYKSV